MNQKKQKTLRTTKKRGARHLRVEKTLADKDVGWGGVPSTNAEENLE